jgi:hypothetical protein
MFVLWAKIGSRKLFPISSGRSYWWFGFPLNGSGSPDVCATCFPFFNFTTENQSPVSSKYPMLLNMADLSSRLLHLFTMGGTVLVVLLSCDVGKSTVPVPVGVQSKQGS